jgi:hypothetical protein
MEHPLHYLVAGRRAESSQPFNYHPAAV